METFCSGKVNCTIHSRSTLMIVYSLGGMTGAVVTSPFDVVKTRLQSDLFTHSASQTVSPGAFAAGAVKARGGLWHFVDTVYLIRYANPRFGYELTRFQADSYRRRMESII
jgi:hypothetical protein